MSDSRQLKPTAKRRQQARREGRVAASNSLVGGACWLGLAVLASLFGAQFLVAGKQAVAQFWNQPIQLGTSDSLSTVHGAFAQLAVALGSLLSMIFAMAVLGRLAQVGILWTPTRILPQFDRIQPGARLTELFSLDKLAQAMRAFSVFTLLMVVLVIGLWHGRNSIVQMAMSPDVGTATLHLMVRWGVQIGASLFVVGLLDYAYQRYRFEQSLQMTPDELRAEIQAVQENPQIGAGRRGLRQKIQSQHPSGSA